MSQKYDVFLSHKNLSGAVETQDTHLAREIYAFLTAKGLQFFLSGVSLRQLGTKVTPAGIKEFALRRKVQCL